MRTRVIEVSGKEREEHYATHPTCERNASARNCTSYRPSSSDCKLDQLRSTNGLLANLRLMGRERLSIAQTKTASKSVSVPGWISVPDSIHRSISIFVDSVGGGTKDECREVRLLIRHLQFQEGILRMIIGIMGLK